MIVRSIEPGDLEATLALGAAMHAESVVRLPPIDRDRWARQLQLMVLRPDMVFGAIAVENAPIGMVTGVMGDWSFSPAPRAAGDVLYVLPEHRSDGLAVRALLQAFEGWARIRAGGPVTIMLGSSTGLHNDRGQRFFAAHGYQGVGPVFRKELA